MSSRTTTATRLRLREQVRQPLLLVLLVVLPFFFITYSIASTEPIPRRVGLPGGGEVITTMRDIHGAVMAAITIAFLAALAGVFTISSAQEADRRLVVAGFRPAEALLPRLAVLLGVCAVVVAVALGVTALSFSPASWPAFLAGNVLVALTYACLGILAGAALGRLAATYVALFLALLGTGILQNPMFGDGTPGGAAVLFPDHGAGRVIIDGAFSEGFDATMEAALAVGWLAVLGAVVAVSWRRLLRPR